MSGARGDSAPDGGTVYGGGAFTMAGPPTGGAALVDPTAGARSASFPRVEGLIAAVAPDGAGGWYVGGLFNTIGGVARRNPAHVAADLTVASWDPSPDQQVGSLIFAGTLSASATTIYLGGAFTSAGGQTRRRAAAFDLATGLYWARLMRGRQMIAREALVVR